MPPCGEASLSPSPLRPELGKSGRMWTFRLLFFLTREHGENLSERLCLIPGMAVTLAGGQSGDRFLTGSRFLWSSQWMEGAVRLGGGWRWRWGACVHSPGLPSRWRKQKTCRWLIECVKCVCVCAHGFPSPSQPMKVSMLWMAIKTQPVSQAGAI